MKSNPLIVALDVETLDDAKKLVGNLKDSIEIYKVGSQLFTAYGPEAVHFILEQRKKVFLDLKFHDIPNTVANAVSSAVGLVRKGTGLAMLTIHTQGGEEMLKRAVDAADKKSKSLGILRPNILGITVLTSDEKVTGTSEIVLERARLAKHCGLDGVVASSQEAALIRRELGEELVIVTPGIRPAGSETGDQKRVMTPKEAIKNGSNYLVIGRPIVMASDPYKAAQSILNEING